MSELSLGVMIVSERGQSTPSNMRPCPWEVDTGGRRSAAILLLDNTVALASRSATEEYKKGGAPRTRREVLLIGSLVELINEMSTTFSIILMSPLALNNLRL